jgi:FAD/FMN-containing dehydrogenase
MSLEMDSSGGSLRITCVDGTVSDVSEETLSGFAEQLDGSVARPGEAAFDAATTIWNGMIRKRPALVVRAASTRDVVRTIGFVRDNQLELSVRGGGHNIAGLSLCDRGVTLDMSGLRDVQVDVDARTARVGAGCTLGDVDRATQQHGLAATLGFISATGVAGLTVGGGCGYLTRRFGYTVDDLDEVEIVTADGIVRRASRTQNEDLFWAIRGGGGNFGVVTEFVFKLHEVGPKITGGIIAWHASEADAVLALYRELVESAPRELTAVVLRRNAPPAPWLPAEAHGKPIIGVLVCHSGDTQQAERDLAKLRNARRGMMTMSS